MGFVHRFVMHHPLVETAIVGASNEMQLKDNLAILERGPLDLEMLECIDNVHVNIPNPAP